MRIRVWSSDVCSADLVQAKLEGGARVADVGCGHGASTIVMAKAFPNSRFFGFDYHPASIERAQRAAEEAGVADRVAFEVAPAKEFPGADRSEEHTSEIQSLMRISYAGFCLKKKNKKN